MRGSGDAIAPVSSSAYAPHDRRKPRNSSPPNNRNLRAAIVGNQSADCDGFAQVPAPVHFCRNLGQRSEIGAATGTKNGTRTRG